MKAILEFDLEEHSDRLAHKRSVNATNAYIAMHDFSNLLRQYVKYKANIGPGTKVALPEGYHVLTEKESEIVSAIVENIAAEYYEILENSDVRLEDLE
jgi:hypothetical protein